MIKRAFFSASRLVAMAAVTAGLGTPVSLFAEAGDVYQGSLSEEVLYRIAPDGTASTFLVGAYANWLAFDLKGNLFSSELNAVVKITPSRFKSTFASNLVSPAGLAFDQNGNLYVADAGTGGAGAGVIYQITPGGARTLFANGLSGPAGLGFDRTGNLYVAESGAGRITKVSATGAKSTFAAGLSFPQGIAVDRRGNLYVAVYGAGSILKYNSAGVASVFATGFNSPSQLALDRSGNLYVSNFATREVAKFTASGVRSTFHSGTAVGGLAAEPATAAVTNISTRGVVQTGDRVLIGGFIVHGTLPKPVIIRGIGPTLGNFGVANSLQDPTLQVFNGSNAAIASNDNWQQSPNAGQIPPNRQPLDPREPAVMITLDPGSYTTILSGKNNTTGVGLIEVYDQDTSTFSELFNVSTRGFVGTGDELMIGGFITEGGNGSTQVLIRAVGPSLAQFGVAGVLNDPTVALYNANGVVLASNNNWRDSQQEEIAASGYAPASDLEPAIVASLPAGNYTEIVSGFAGTTGVALVEVYSLQ